MNGATTRRRSPLRRLALLLAAVLATGAAGAIAFAQPYHPAGGRGRAPQMVAPRMAGPRAAWGVRGPAFPPRRYEEPANRYGAPRGGWNLPGGARYGPAGRWFAAPPGYARPAPITGGWRRGGFLPPAYQGSVIQDYGRYHLRRPPYGYDWVRVGNQLLLISSGTGMIFDVVPAY